MFAPNYEHFKFEIGQIVVAFKGKFKIASDGEIAIETFQVVERIYQECPGGVQLHYVCRPQTTWYSEKRDLIQFNEIELSEFLDMTKSQPEGKA